MAVFGDDFRSTPSIRSKGTYMTGFYRLLVSIAVFLLPFAAWADDVLLTVSTHGEVREFDLLSLTEMEPVTFQTSTIWTEGVQTFRGVLLSTILDKAGVFEGHLKASAINDYAVEIPVSDAVNGGPMIAYSLNGKEMTIRDKGPLWLVYPYDTNPAYQSEVIYSRSIWQLVRLEVIP